MTEFIILLSMSLTPRQAMQKCEACMTSARPSGLVLCWITSASCTTASSWIWGRPMIHSARRAYLDRPMTLVCSLGITPIHSLPMMGHRWWLHALRTVMGPTIISSFKCSALGNSVMVGAVV